MWQPWKQRQREAEEARRRLETAARQETLAVIRRQAVERLAARSRTSSAALRRQIEINGWTELLQEAWARR